MYSRRVWTVNRGTSFSESKSRVRHVVSNKRQAAYPLRWQTLHTRRECTETRAATNQFIRQEQTNENGPSHTAEGPVTSTVAGSNVTGPVIFRGSGGDAMW
jgi:hypothetical protein